MRQPPFLVTTRRDAIDKAKTLAFEGASATEIQTELTLKGFGEELNPDEIDQIILQAGVARKLIRHPSYKWPRLLGVVAILLGLVGMSLGGFESVSSRSPTRYGVVAIILGLILIIKPDWGSTEVK